MAAFQHKHDEICPSGAVITFAVETLDHSRGRPVACVLMNAAEVAIFHHELVFSTNALPADRVTVLTDANDFWTDKQGRLWLMTYPQLSEILAASRRRPEEDLSMLLHMGCGQYTWDIVRACHDLWKWAWDVEVGKEKATVRVYTISNIKESIYCNAPASRLSMSGLTRPRFELCQPEGFSAAVARVQQEVAAHEDLRKSMSGLQHCPKQTNRAAVFTTKAKLLEAYERHSCEPRGYVQLGGDMTGLNLIEWVEIILQREFDVKTLLVEPNVGTIGTVRNLGMVLVLPVKQGFFFDRRVSNVVLRQDMPMSRAEVRYACRVAVSPSDSGIDRVVSAFTTRADFKKFPSIPMDLLAFTGDFPAILLHFCDQSYFGGNKTSPIRLPKDEKMTEEYLRRLELRGLTKRRGGPLTDLGRTTAWWHHNGRIRNFNVANLLAIASTIQGNRASALVQMAAVLYHPESSLMSSIGPLLKFQIPEGRSTDFHRRLPDRTRGFALSYLERGPIWIAVAVWADQRNLINQLSPFQASELSLCDNMLQVSRQMLKVVEDNWAAMTQAWESQGGPKIESEPAIDEEDFLFLEECIVRVWMHNLVLVGLADHELDVFACDLTSGAFIARPAGDPVKWAWLAQEVGSEPLEGWASRGVFAVYTVLHRLTGPEGRIQYVPEDLTFVSSKAVRRVLQDVAISKRWNGFRLPDEHDLLRTKYPTRFEQGELDENEQGAPDEERLGDL